MQAIQMRKHTTELRSEHGDTLVLRSRHCSQANVPFLPYRFTAAGASLTRFLYYKHRSQGRLPFLSEFVQKSDSHLLRALSGVVLVQMYPTLIERQAASLSF